MLPLFRDWTLLQPHWTQVSSLSLTLSAYLPSRSSSSSYIVYAIMQKDIERSCHLLIIYLLYTPQPPDEAGRSVFGGCVSCEGSQSFSSTLSIHIEVEIAIAAGKRQQQQLDIAAKLAWEVEDTLPAQETRNVSVTIRSSLFKEGYFHVKSSMTQVTFHFISLIPRFLYSSYSFFCFRKPSSIIHTQYHSRNFHNAFENLCYRSFYLQH